MPSPLSFFVAGSENSSSAGSSDTMESSEHHLSSSAGSSNSSIDQHSLSSSLTYVDATELQNSEAPTFPSEMSMLMSSLRGSGGEAIELIADILLDGQVPWAFYVDVEAYTLYLVNRRYPQSQEIEDEEDQGTQNSEGDEGLETNTNGTYRDYGRSSGRSGDVRERMLPRRGAVDYQFARRGGMS
jgi:hypothetical protein